MRSHTSRLLLLTVTLMLVKVCHAQGVPQDPKPTVVKGTVIIYDVKENKVSYQYTVTVNKYSETEGIAFNWSTNEKPARSGTTSMPFTNLTEGKNLMVKPVAGTEKLTGDQVRLFLLDDLLISLIGNKTVDLSIDGKENTFLYLATKAETTELDYNGKKITVDYTSGDAGDMSVGFIAVGSMELMHSFRSKDLQFTLRSINTK